MRIDQSRTSVTYLRCLVSSLSPFNPFAVFSSHPLFYSLIFLILGDPDLRKRHSSAMIAAQLSPFRGLLSEVLFVIVPFKGECSIMKPSSSVGVLAGYLMVSAFSQ